MILPISGVHRGTLAALRYARSLSDDVTAVHVSVDPAEAEALRQKWELWGEGVRLVILDSPYRLLLEPLLEYIETGSPTSASRTRSSPSWCRSSCRAAGGTTCCTRRPPCSLRMALLFRPGIVITDVPYQVGADVPDEGA